MNVIYSLMYSVLEFKIRDCICENICLLISFITLGFGGGLDFSMIKLFFLNSSPSNFRNLLMACFDSVK